MRPRFDCSRESAWRRQPFCGCSCGEVASQPRSMPPCLDNANVSSSRFLFRLRVVKSATPDAPASHNTMSITRRSPKGRLFSRPPVCRLRNRQTTFERQPRVCLTLQNSSSSFARRLISTGSHSQITSTRSYRRSASMPISHTLGSSTWHDW